MGIFDSFLKIATGSQERMLTPEQKRKKEEAQAAQLAKRQMEALERARTARETGPAASAAAQTAKKYAKTEAHATSASPSTDLVAYQPRQNVILPGGRVANYGWQALNPAELSPIYGRLDEAAIGRILADTTEDDIDDPTSRLLDHISPSYTKEDLQFYQIDDRFYTTLPVKKFPPDFGPALWYDLLFDTDGKVDRWHSTLSLHYWGTSVVLADKMVTDELDKERIKLEDLRGQGASALVIADSERRIESFKAEQAKIRSRDQSHFRVSAYLRVGANTLPQLHEQVNSLKIQAVNRKILFDKVIDNQRAAYMSSMPFSVDPANNTDSMLASRAAQLFPFITRPHQEIDERNQPTGVLYGLHLYNLTPVMINPYNRDRTTEVTTVLGATGSGKSFWLRCHIGRLAMTGWQILAIDPLGDFNKWFTENEGQIISLYPNSPAHINPLQLTKVKSLSVDGQEIEEWEDVDTKINQRLKPLFRLLLGDEYMGMVDGLIGQGLRAYYDRYGIEEHLLVDLVDILLDLNQKNEEQLSPATLSERQRLIDTLKLRLLKGEFRSYFDNKTNVKLNSRRINFDLSGAKDGLQQAFAAYLAVTMVCNFAASSMDRKMVLVDEVHRLFKSADSSEGIQKTLDDLLRTHRHYNTAVTFATQFTPAEEDNVGLTSLLTSTTTWVLMRATDRMLKAAVDHIGEDKAEFDLLQSILHMSEAQETSVDRSPRRGIIYRAGVPIPFVSVALDFEFKADDQSSALRKQEQAAQLNP
jgi:hypothetical protein